MLRTTLLYAFSVLLALVILVVSFFAATFRAVRAGDKIATSPAAVATSSPTANYFLPYPGILPDSPLWPVKALRDRIFLIFTFDPKAKTERLLLYADKRLGAARALIEGGKIELGVNTAVKGEKYLLASVEEYLQTKPTGTEDRLKLAIVKHREVITLLQERSPELHNLLSEALTINQSAGGFLQ